MEGSFAVVALVVGGFDICSNAAGEYEYENEIVCSNVAGEYENEFEYMSRRASSRINGKQWKCVRSKCVPAHPPICYKSRGLAAAPG